MDSVWNYVYFSYTILDFGGKTIAGENPFFWHKWYEPVYHLKKINPEYKFSFQT